MQIRNRKVCQHVAESPNSSQLTALDSRLIINNIFNWPPVNICTPLTLFNMLKWCSCRTIALSLSIVDCSSLSSEAPQSPHLLEISTDNQMEHTEDNSIVFNLILTSFNEAQNSLPHTTPPPHFPLHFLPLFPPTAVDLILFYVFPAGWGTTEESCFLPSSAPLPIPFDTTIAWRMGVPEMPRGRWVDGWEDLTTRPSCRSKWNKVLWSLLRLAS